MGSSKFYVELDEKSLIQWFRKQATDYFKGQIKSDFNSIVKEAIEERLKGVDLLEMVKDAVRQVLPVEKIIRKGVEKMAIKKDWIMDIVNKEISKRVKEAMPQIIVKNAKGLEELFSD